MSKTRKPLPLSLRHQLLALLFDPENRQPYQDRLNADHVSLLRELTTKFNLPAGSARHYLKGSGYTVPSSRDQKPEPEPTPAPAPAAPAPLTIPVDGMTFAMLKRVVANLEQGIEFQAQQWWNENSHSPLFDPFVRGAPFYGLNPESQRSVIDLFLNVPLIGIKSTGVAE